jgi:hypothetical protein
MNLSLNLEKKKADLATHEKGPKYRGANVLDGIMDKAKTVGKLAGGLLNKVAGKNTRLGKLGTKIKDKFTTPKVDENGKPIAKKTVMEKVKELFTKKKPVTDKEAIDKTAKPGGWKDRLQKEEALEKERDEKKKADLAKHEKGPKYRGANVLDILGEKLAAMKDKVSDFFSDAMDDIDGPDRKKKGKGKTKGRAPRGKAPGRMGRALNAAKSFGSRALDVGKSVGSRVLSTGSTVGRSLLSAGGTVGRSLLAGGTSA